jgi:hypothetical protein
MTPWCMAQLLDTTEQTPRLSGCVKILAHRFLREHQVEALTSLIPPPAHRKDSSSP